jgi:hypothetical protein
MKREEYVERKKRRLYAEDSGINGDRCFAFCGRSRSG